MDGEDIEHMFVNSLFEESKMSFDHCMKEYHVDEPSSYNFIITQNVSSDNGQDDFFEYLIIEYLSRLIHEIYISPRKDGDGQITIEEYVINDSVDENSKYSSSDIKLD